ncbi:MAG: hypothetical protein L3J62_10545 [Gammaproteobacteria bacterium]|nr:hypothetical protein [Gammaproteobacteria bacterium]MCF6231202.1 hypothetical protein [Gammaproteobacteria bacterium]
MKNLLSIAALILALTPVAVFAAESSYFEKLDTDSNGVISVDEASSDSVLSKIWDDIDGDKSGVLESAEFSRFEEMLNSDSSLEEAIKVE